MRFKKDDKNKIAVMTLGCPKNEVDSDVLKGQLIQGGFILTEYPEESDVILINTCGFIKEAKEESIQAILEAVSLKQHKPNLRVVVWGCLSQRYKDEIKKEIPEVDAFFGVEPFENIGRFLINKNYVLKENVYQHRDLSTPSHTAYVKIADGCDHLCAFCAIPLIKGDYKSRKIEEIVEECKQLVEKGVIEINLVAQDTTAFGVDLNINDGLVLLLKELEKIKGLQWIRILYGHPAHVSETLIDTIAQNKKICHYLDIPLQHSHPEILKRMGRRTSRQKIEELLYKLKDKIPDIVLRTAFIVGYPGETEEHFDDLLRFVHEFKFDRMGAFIFSPEEGTAAYDMKDIVQISKAEKRLETLMTAQQKILLEKNQSFVNCEIPVLVDGYESETGLYFGRTQGDALEIDQLVWIDGDVSIGAINCVKVMSSSVYDLKGIPV